MQQIKDAAKKQVEQRMGKNKIGIKTVKIKEGFINHEVEKCLAEKADLIPRDKWVEQNQ